MKRHSNHKPSSQDPRSHKRPSPVLTVALAVAAILLLLTLFRYLSRDNGRVDPKVTVESVAIDHATSKATRPQTSRLPDEGEVYRTADRLRETAALAYVASLYIAEERIHGRTPPSLQNILNSLAVRGLYPPGVSNSGATDWLRSDFALIQLRYRPDPPGIEALSYGRSAVDGAALIVRIPGEGSEGDRGVLFFANRLGKIDAPSPFGSVAQYATLGWIEQPIHNLDMSDQQKKDIQNWLASVRRSKKE